MGQSLPVACTSPEREGACYEHWAGIFWALGDHVHLATLRTAKRQLTVREGEGGSRYCR